MPHRHLLSSLRPGHGIRTGIAVLLAIWCPTGADADWTCDDPLQSVDAFDQPPYTAFSQWPGNAVADGAGGMFLCWEENANAGDARCRIQRLDDVGNRLWGNVGEMIVDMDDQHTPSVLPDGSGGLYAMVASSPTPEPNFEVRIQRFDADGNRLWGDLGKIAYQACGISSYRPQLLADGTGGLFLVVVTSGVPEQVRAQRIAGDGTLLWGNSCGVLAATSVETVFSAAGTADGSGGLFLSYSVFEGNGTGGLNVKSQHMDSAGLAQWGAGGTMVCSLPGDQFAGAPHSDGNGGMIVAWYARGVNDDYVGGQRLDANGQALWSFNGDQLLPMGYYLTMAMPDGEGGIWLSVWSLDNERDNYIQRINGDGDPVFPSVVPLTQALNRQYGASLVPDGSGGCFAVWADWRDGGAMEQDIYFQHVTINGDLLEPVDGTPITAEPEIQGRDGIAVASDDAGNLFAAWNNDIPTRGIFAEKVSCSATTEVDLPPLTSGTTIGLVTASPNPWDAQSGPLRLRASVTSASDNAPTSIVVFDGQGRRIRRLTGGAVTGVNSDGTTDANASHPGADFVWDGRDDSGRPVPSGAYYFQTDGDLSVQRGSVRILR